MDLLLTCPTVVRHTDLLISWAFVSCWRPSVDFSYKNLGRWLPFETLWVRTSPAVQLFYPYFLFQCDSTIFDTLVHYEIFSKCAFHCNPNHRKRRKKSKKNRRGFSFSFCLSFFSCFSLFLLCSYFLLLSFSAIRCIQYGIEEEVGQLYTRETLEMDGNGKKRRNDRNGELGETRRATGREKR